MNPDSDLDTRLRALADSGTAVFAAPDAEVARRLDVVRRALRRQAVPDPGQDHLLVREGQVERWQPLAGDVVIGTAPDVAIRLHSRFVSAHHCRLSRGPDGWTVEDLGSKNGVEVNGQRASQCRLCDGDAVRLADVTLILVHRREPVE